MNNRDWEEFGEKLRRTILDVAENGATYTANQVADWLDKNLGRRNELILYKKKPVSKVAAVLLAVAGYGLGAAVLFYAVMILLGAALLNELVFGLGLSVLNALLLSGCGVMAYKGTTSLTRLSRFKDYVQEIGMDEYCTIDRLARKVGKNGRFVIKDLERMIAKGWFLQGHLDQQKTCLMVTDRMYSQYRQLEQQREQHLRDEAERQEQKRREEEAQKTSATSGKGLSPEMEEIIRQGDAYVKKIRACNDAIPGEAISAKIYRMEELVDKIFDRVEQNPASVSDIRRLMEYYLPTTIKLLETYAQMDAQPVGGENIQTAKREIEETLDTINIAFEKLLDSLFQETAWDVSSDISVLKTMLAQEGLGEDRLKKVQNGGARYE